MINDDRDRTDDFSTRGGQAVFRPLGTSYIAARRGEIPTIRIGRRVRVPVRTLEAMLDAVGKPCGKGAA